MAVMHRQPLVAADGGRPHRRPGWALACVAATLLAWQGWAAWADLKRLQNQRDGLSALARAAATAQPGAMPAAERTRHAQIEAVANTLALPATGLLDALEANPERSVVLLRIEQDLPHRSIELDAWAPNAAARAKYLQGLSGLPGLNGLVAADASAGKTLAPAAAGAWRGQHFHVSARWPEARQP
jgi:hypothetical protein